MPHRSDHPVSVTQETPEEQTADTFAWTTSQAECSANTCALVREQRPAHHLLVMYIERIVWSSHIDQAGVVSFSQVVQHRGFIEAGEVSHVLHFTEARGVHPLNLLPGQSDPPLAVCQLNLHFITTLLPNTGRLGGGSKEREG